MELHAQHVDGKEDCSLQPAEGDPLENKGHTALMTRQATGNVEGSLGWLEGKFTLPARDGGVLKSQTAVLEPGKHVQTLVLPCNYYMWVAGGSKRMNIDTLSIIMSIFEICDSVCGGDTTLSANSLYWNCRWLERPVPTTKLVPMNNPVRHNWNFLGN